MMRHVSLFSGIGMDSIASGLLGYETTAFVEQNEFCQQVLRKRFPRAVIHGAIRTVTCAELMPDGRRIGLLSGGFPCQDLSVAGSGAGLEGARSGLWFEMLRIIQGCQPRRVLIENVAALRTRGLDVVIDGLARVGYGCWWDCVPALAVGAPHLRDRIWITAVPFEDMPGPIRLGGSYDMPRDGKLPRAGANTSAGLLTLEPSATVRMCKEATGAVRREDGVTWLTAIDSPLFPTPSAVSYGSNQGGAAGRTGKVRHSLASMAANQMWPTPERSDGTGGRVSTELGGTRPSGAKRAVTLASAVAHRCWPPPHGMSAPNAARAAGPSGNELGWAVNRSWPTPTQRDWKDRGLLPEAVRNEAEQRCWPSAATATASQGPGREGRAGGPNIRTAVAETSGAGPLNPAWVEWLMGTPIGWTEPACDEPVQLDWLSEYGLPRVLRDVPDRKHRLMALGNSIVWRVAHHRLAQAHELLGLA